MNIECIGVYQASTTGAKERMLVACMAVEIKEGGEIRGDSSQKAE